MLIKRKIATAIATGALLANTFTPFAFAETQIEISGNGSASNSNANLSASHTTTVVQNNDAKINNTVNSKASTGNNQASDNTGGDVVIDTGNARSHVDIANKANLNVADVASCDCDGDTHVLISGNGSNSTNRADVTKHNDTFVHQDNKAWINNDVDSKAKTGNNDADRNTGGDVVIVTGHAESGVDIHNKANANFARIGNDSTNGNGKLSALIVGNGSGSDNKINLDHSRFVTLVQSNDAYFNNDVDSKAKTGHNRANDNTDSNVTIDTGNARSHVDIDNKANFNSANVDCGCLVDTKAKISGNGSYSYNNIWADLRDDLQVFQDKNHADFYNDVDSFAKTGKNDANRNTGPVDVEDPVFVFTGAADSHTGISNKSNVNIFGRDFGADNQFHVGFDLHDLFASLHS